MLSAPKTKGEKKDGEKKKKKKEKERAKANPVITLKEVMKE